MKKIYIVLSILSIFLFSCTKNENYENNYKMTFMDMIERGEINQIDNSHIILSTQFKPKEIIDEKKVLLLDKDDCKIEITISKNDDKSYFVYFDFIGYSTQDYYKSYNLYHCYINPRNTAEYIYTPMPIRIKYKSGSNEIEESIGWHHKDYENVPNLYYEIKIRDEYKNILGDLENINIEIIVDCYYFQETK